MAPIVNRVIEGYEGDVVFKVLNANAGEGSQMAQQFGIQFVPTFVFMDSNGQVVDQVIGAMSEDALRQRIEDLE
ncbi:MAG: hypothetical protein Kow0067_16300 [Coriobacteriia bacterium]